jgi:hypothetical protein
MKNKNIEADKLSVFLVAVVFHDVFGFARKKDLAEIFKCCELPKAIRILRKHKIISKPFKLLGKLAYRIDINKCKAQIAQYKKETEQVKVLADKDSQTISQCYNVLQEFFFVNKLYDIHLELAAHCNVFDERAIKSIDYLIERDKFDIALDRVRLFDVSTLPENERTAYYVYKATLVERNGGQHETNVLLKKVGETSLGKIIGYKEQKENELVFGGAAAVENYIKSAEGHADKTNDFKLLFAYLYVLFENTHGNNKNRTEIQKCIAYMLKKIESNVNKSKAPQKDSPDELMLRYWKMHVDLEYGEFEYQKYIKWIEDYKGDYANKKSDYRYLHNLRRAYCDYVVEVLCSLQLTANNDSSGGFSINSKPCLEMLRIINDEQLKSDLACYVTHWKRMCIGDYINYYLLFKRGILREELTSEEISHLTDSHSLNEINRPTIKKKDFFEPHILEKDFSEPNTLSLEKIATKNYQDCIDEFKATNDKSEITTLTRLASIRMIKDGAPVKCLEKQIDRFYQGSNFEVFVSHGIALKIKLFLCDFYRKSVIAMDRAANFVERSPEEDQKQQAKIKQANEEVDYAFKGLISAISEINEQREKGIEFTKFSKSKFAVLYKMSEKLLDLDKTSTERRKAKLSAEKAKLSGIIDIQEGIIALDNYMLDRLDTAKSLREVINLIKYYPIVPL